MIRGRSGDRQQAGVWSGVSAEASAFKAVAREEGGQAALNSGISPSARTTMPAMRVRWGGMWAVFQNAVVTDN